MAILDPAIASFVDSLAPRTAPPTPASAREELVALQATTVARPAVKIDDRRVGPAVDVRIVRPVGARGLLPGII